MKEKFIIKRITDKYFNIMEKHNNSKWAVDELEYLIYEVHKGEYDKLSDLEKSDVNRIINVLRNK